ncbi:MAG: FtsK/SpoIIIE family DNA translocase [Christensenellales bacterium]
MARASKHKKKQNDVKKNKVSSGARREILGIVLIAMSVLVFLGVFTTSTGVFGSTIQAILLGLFGIFAYISPFALLFLGVYAIIQAKKTIRTSQVVLSFLIVLFAMSFFQLFFEIKTDSYWAYISDAYSRYGVIGKTGSGAVGALLAMPAQLLFGNIGAGVVFGAGILICLILLAKFSPHKVIEQSAKVIKDYKERHEQTKQLYNEILDDTMQYEKLGKSDKSVYIGDFFGARGASSLPGDRKTAAGKEADSFEGDSLDGVEQIPLIRTFSRFKIDKPVTDARNTTPANSNPEDGEAVTSSRKAEYIKPPLTLLKPIVIMGKKLNEDHNARAQIIEETLASFGITAKVVRISHGPRLTRFELQPAPGVKISRIVNLSDDIAMNLAAEGVRIEAPIPGKAAIGIEVPNRNTGIVALRDIIESPEFDEQKGECIFGVGKDISGNRIIADLTKMPHLLVAGTTGSGKSVMLHSILMSFLFKYTPQELRLLIVDPKMVEFEKYNDIPHLLLPVVTDVHKAAGVLKWAVNEMTLRYKSFNEKGVRDLPRYNKLAAETAEMSPLPRIVVIVDELADMMMTTPQDVEDAIVRVAQLGRAAGIHLILATQRPSATVITGLIKANIPSRISLRVSSQLESRIILDLGGAEKLLGNGDMLYFPNELQKPVRSQGCWVSDGEIDAVTSFLKKSNESTEYRLDILDAIPDEEVKTNELCTEGQDELFPRAVEIVLDSGQASISMIQRRLRVGYARAARLIDEMEQQNIVSGFEGSKPRDVLITRADYEHMFH